VATYLQHKRQLFFLKRTDEQQKQKLFTHLSLLSADALTRFFIPVLQSENEPLQTGKLRVSTTEKIYFLHLQFLPVNADEVAYYARIKTEKEKILLCRAIEKQAYELSSRLQIRIVPENEIYLLIKKKNAFPEKYLGEDDITKKNKRRFQICFAKSNAKRFLVSGALILATSLLTPFPYYYLVFGIILCGIALFIRIFGQT
jgi:hypothetical protein